MTYCNARLPQALFVAVAPLSREERYRADRHESLDFLLEKTRNEQGSYDPIGNAPTENRWLVQARTTKPTACSTSSR